MLHKNVFVLVCVFFLSYKTTLIYIGIYDIIIYIYIILMCITTVVADAVIKINAYSVDVNILSSSNKIIL